MIEEYSINQCSNLIRPTLPTLVTSISSNGEHDIAPMSTVVIASYNPPLFSVAIHPSRKTYKNIKATKEFVVNIPTLDIADQLFKTADKTIKDKFKETGLTKLKSEKVKPARIKECIAWIELELHDELWPKDSERSILIGKPVAASVKKGILENGRFIPEKTKIPIHMSGNVFSVAEKTFIVGKKVMNWQEYMDYISNA